MFYLPVWTLEEILECIRLCYPSKDEKEVQAAFNLWGGGVGYEYFKSFKSSTLFTVQNITT